MSKSFRKGDKGATYKGTAPITYINNDPNAGIKYDWKLIRKEFAKLKVPSMYFTPMQCPLESVKYHVNFSARSIGKTTNWLLLGMIMNQLYGTIIQYMRQSESQVVPKITKQMFDAIIFNNYVSKITNGRWNTVYYNSRRWYYANTDDTGNIVEIAPEHFCNMLVVANHHMYKSGYNAPTGDVIIFDEFVNDHAYYPDEFVMFCDLIKTIARDRESVIIAMLSNNTDKESPYFSEMEIYDDVRAMRPDDEKTCVTEQGTAIYVKYVAADNKKQKIMTRLNKMYFGFKNKRLGSITGADWAIKPRQHIPKDDNFRYIIKNLFIYHNGRYARIDIVDNENLGLCGYCHWATITYPDSVILTMEDRFDNRYHYGLGSYTIRSTITGLLDENRMYYASNDVASFISNYIRTIEKNY